MPATGRMGGWGQQVRPGRRCLGWAHLALALGFQPVFLREHRWLGHHRGSQAQATCVAQRAGLAPLAGLSRSAGLAFTWRNCRSEHTTSALQAEAGAQVGAVAGWANPMLAAHAGQQLPMRVSVLRSAESQCICAPAGQWRWRVECGWRASWAWLNARRDRSRTVR